MSIYNIYIRYVDEIFMQVTDIEVTSNHNSFSTKVYHKPTDYGKFLNFNCECADKYKKV